MLCATLIVFCLISCSGEGDAKGKANSDIRRTTVTEKATFAAGCFWGVEELFRKTKGVLKTSAGYTGGDFEDPTYEEVCSDRTGHAEAVLIEYDPKVISYDELLKIFWNNHDPTTPNRQGPDVGSQYRSAIFYHTEAQREEAERSRRELAESGRFKAPIVTKIVAATKFWKAEEYHQKYLLKKGGSCLHHSNPLK